MNKKQKILGLIFSVILFLGVLVLAVFSSIKTAELPYKDLKIKGAVLYPEVEYKRYTGINKETINAKSLYEIREEFLSHPYVQSADIEIDAARNIIVYLFEKDIKALLLLENKMFLLSNNKELIKILANSNTLDFPVITNTEIKNYEKIKHINNNEIDEALKILSVNSLVNNKLYNDISEINMRYGKDIVLNYSSLSMPILFGRKNYMKKIITLNSLINQKEKINSFLQSCVYVDLRFDKNVVLGFNDKIGIN